jgi:hypothetical protein
VATDIHLDQTSLFFNSVVTLAGTWDLFSLLIKWNGAMDCFAGVPRCSTTLSTCFPETSVFLRAQIVYVVVSA